MEMNFQKFLKQGDAFLKKRNRWLKLILLFNVCVLLIQVVAYTNKTGHLLKYHFDSDKISSYDPEVYEDYLPEGRVDEEYEGGLYDVIPSMFLKKGYYRYTVTYEGSSEGSFVWPHTYEDYYNVIEQAVTYIGDGRHSNTEEFWLNADLDLALRAYYSGKGSFTVLDFEIEETPVAANIHLFTGLLLLLGMDLLIALAVYQKKHGISDQDKYIFIALAAISFFASFPFLTGYTIQGHDLNFHFIRIEGIKDGLLGGQFPVRINPTFHNGYGYAAPIFYGDLFLYLSGFLRLIGFSLTACYNVYGIFMNVLTCFGSYYCFKRIWENAPLAVMLSLLYTLAPYRLMCMYLRSAAGEYSAMAFLPFIAYGLFRIYTEDVHKKEYKWCFLPLVAGLTGIINTHVLTGEITGGVILLVCFVLFFKTFQKQRFWALVKTVLWTLGVNLWFLVPFVDFALTQHIKVFETTEDVRIQTTGVYLTQLASLFQKYSGMLQNDQNALDGMVGEMPQTLGMPLVLGMFLCVAMLFVRCREKKAEKKQALFVLLVALLLCWMTTFYFPWDRLSNIMPFFAKLITTLQFLWRILSVATMAATLATGFGLSLLSAKEGKGVGNIAGIILCVLISVSSMQYMQDCVEANSPVKFNNAKNIHTVHAASSDEFIITGSSYEMLVGELDPKIYGGVLEEYEKEGLRVSFRVAGAGENCYVLLPLLNYKGYRVTSGDGLVTNANLVNGDYNRMRINIPEGYSGEVTVKYQELWYWRIADIISLICIVYLVFRFLFSKYGIKIRHQKEAAQGSRGE